VTKMVRAVLPYAARASRVLAAAFMVLAGAVFLINAGVSVAYRYPLDYGEAPLVDQAMRLQAGERLQAGVRLQTGERLYDPDLAAPPYTISNYPPLYPLALVPGVALFGPTFAPGRLLSVLCAIATAVALWFIIRTHTQQRLAAWLAATTFLAWPYVVEWSALLRIDLLALALSTWALYVVSRWPRDRRATVVAGVLLVGAVFTRQSYGLAAPLAAFVWLWARAGWRRALLLAAVAAVLGGALLLLLVLTTGGGFWTHIVSANVNAFDFNRVGDRANEVARFAPVMLAGGLAVLLLGPRALSAWPLVVPYLVGSLVSAVTIGKVGSNVNYLLEFCAAISLAASALVGWLRQTSGPPPSTARLWRGVLGVVAVVAIALQTGFLVHTSLDGPVQARKARRATERAVANLEGIVQASADPVLADEYMGLLTIQGRSLYLQPFEMTQLSLAGLWDQQPLLAEIAQHRFPLILIHHFPDWLVYKERWTQEMVRGVLASYEATGFYGDTLVFQPRVHRLLSTAEPCPGAPWPAPTRGDFGIMWFTRELAFLGEGYEGTVPVTAVADGLLMRRPEWADAVAIQHDDPLRRGEKVWTFYGNMVVSAEDRSLVDVSFPPGTVAVPVRAGQHLGYQGRSWGTEIRWVHLRFAIAPALEDGSFPAPLVGLEGNEVPVPVEMRLLDPSPYLSTLSSNVMGTPVWLPAQCLP